ncbi:MAG: hypothetical protein EHM12_10520, partial [Dehalococcoidia bacterium]
MPTLAHRIYILYRRHSDFVLLLILFVTFRVLALVAFRPGGLVLDFSDFYWYREFAQLTRQGYYPYYNLWINYPPLFPLVMIAIYQLSALIPPWDYTNLWFTLLLGGFFLVFEIGNFILLYLLALELYQEESGINSSLANEESRIDSEQNAVGINSGLLKGESGIQTALALRPCWIYAALFVPVYSLTGWFESYPLFFFVLSLYLLLKNRPYLSAFFTGVGVMVKLIPFILIPVAVQWVANYKLQIIKYSAHKNLSANNSPSTIRHSPFTIHPSSLLLHPSSFLLPFDLPRIALYLIIFGVTVLAIAAPFYLMNPALILGPQQINDARLPWQSVWALLDGNYNYGSLPLDLRSLAWNPADKLPSRIPWLPVTVIFGLIYAFFYTRPLNWRKPGHTLAFVGFTMGLFMLWSKGYSPQWLGWLLFFVALLLPNLRGVIYAVLL